MQGQGHVIVRFNIQTKAIEGPSEVCRAEINNVVEIIFVIFLVLRYVWIIFPGIKLRSVHGLLPTPNLVISSRHN